ncbi:MAG: hypothetical protein ACFB14_12755 [Leptolyngbyaceae cyanobacterium]
MPTPKENAQQERACARRLAAKLKGLVGVDPNQVYGIESILSFQALGS